MEKSTKDSIEALEALLKIRESIDQVSSCTTPTAASCSSSPRREGVGAAAAALNIAGSNMLQRNVPNPLLINRFPQNHVQTANAAAVNLQMQYQALSSRQLASVAANAFSMPMYAQANAQAHLNQQHQLPTTIYQPTLTQPSAQTQAQVLSSKRRLPITSQGNPSQPFAPIAPIAPSGKPDVKKDFIRKARIEAALKSKPQRGRKRENLSGLERQELTRTRNREHAKTTRVRKKMRYEELLACEKKYKDLINGQELETSRKSMVLQFMSVRSNLLKPKKRNQNDTSSWNFSFESEASICKNESDALEPSLVAAYKDVQTDCSKFSVDIISGHGQLTAANLASFQAHDAQIISRVSAKVGDKISVVYDFKIQGGEKGIAISNNNEGFAVCELCVSTQTKEEEKCKMMILSTDLVRVKFAELTSEIVSMKIFNESDSVVSFNEKKLQNEDYFPSVVSLEQNLSSSGEKTCKN